MANQDPSAEPLPVIVVARTYKQDENPEMLSTGIRAKFRPVSATLIDAVTSKIKDPAVPRVFIVEKDREVPNPDDPDYQTALAEAARKRGLAALDALIMFGVELLDPVPESRHENGKPTGWYAKLCLLEKQGMIDLSDYDVSEPDVAEFLYKRFIAVSPTDIDRLNRMNRVGQEDVTRAERSF